MDEMRPRTAQKMRKIKIMRSIQAKLTAGFIFLCLFVSLLMGSFMNIYINNMFMNNIQNTAANLASSAALLIDGDIHETFKTEQDSRRKDFIAQRAKLQQFQKDTGVMYVYTLAFNKDNTTRFIIDADTEDPCAINEEYKCWPAMKTAFAGKAIAEKEITTDQWGSQLSGYAPIKNSLGKVVAIACVDIDAKYIAREKQQLLVKVIAVCLVSLLLAIAFSLFLARKMSGPLKLIRDRVDKLASAGGDLTQQIEVNTGDELEDLAGSVNTFIFNLRDLIKKAIHSAQGVSMATHELNVSTQETTRVVEEVAASIQDIASGAAEQANHAQQMVEMVETIERDINDNEDRVEGIATSSEQAQQLVLEGFEAIGEQESKMQANITAARTMENVINDLEQRTRQIEKILETIAGIANQTNLLALNAAIEAARAGEQGKGFAVVAEEVRKLAEESGASVTEIASIMEQIQAGAKRAVAEVNNTNSIVDGQRVAVEHTNSVFQKISDIVKDMANSLHEIRVSSREIKKSSAGISEAIQAIASVAQENAAITEEVSASSQEEAAAMESIAASVDSALMLARELQEVTTKFKTE